MKKNRKWAGICGVLFLLFLAGGFINICCMDAAASYHLEITGNAVNGYGYKICRGERAIIVQPFIPAVAGKRPFRSSEEVRRVGNLVIRKIQRGENYAVSRAELIKLGVITEHPD